MRTHPTASTIKSSKRPYTHRFCWGEGTQLRTKTRIFKSSALTAPAAKGDKRKFSPRRSGFYLDVRRRKKHGKTVPASQDPALYGHKPSAKSSYDTRPAMYYEYKPGKHIVYWFFFPYNSRKGDTHQGDWEHMVVRLDQTNVATQAAYYTHYCSGDIHDWTEIKSLADPLAGQHPPVYIALGGHGAWLTQGSTVLPCGNPKKGVYDRRNGRGTVWQPWLDDFGLLPAASQPWYDMGVGWGREGGLGWGPVGPGKYKTKVLPRGW